jgi:hypothetical protein
MIHAMVVQGCHEPSRAVPSRVDGAKTQKKRTGWGGVACKEKFPINSTQFIILWACKQQHFSQRASFALFCWIRCKIMKESSWVSGRVGSAHLILVLLISLYSFFLLFSLNWAIYNIGNWTFEACVRTEALECK